MSIMRDSSMQNTKGEESNNEPLKNANTDIEDDQPENEKSIRDSENQEMENLAKMDLMYKQMKLCELKDKHVLLDINTSCYLCNKKIQNNTVFIVYPNGHIYHSGCSPDLHIEIKTG